MAKSPREDAVETGVAFVCPACGKGLKVKSELAGKKGKCPHCKEPIRVPGGAGSADLTDARTLAPDASASGTRTVGPLPSGAPAKELVDFLAPPQAADELGRLGPYRVLKVLGHGGMGVVFAAEDPKLHRKVALKAMLPALAASETARGRFLREAQAAAAVEHDHIVPIYQVGEDRGVPFIAMPFLKGEPLDQRLAREGRLPLREVLRIGHETASGLAAAHKQGLIHRDIKPANLWLEEETGRVKILDFGLARAAADSAQLTQAGTIVGTPAYMAPEQVQGQTTDSRCDLFSLGCVLYLMSTGELPFKGADTISTLMAVSTVQPAAPRKITSALPRAFSDVVMHLLAKDPSERIPTAGAVIEALTAVEEQRESPTVSIPRDTVAGRQRPGNRLVLASVLGGVAVLILAGLIVVFLVTSKRRSGTQTDAPAGGDASAGRGGEGDGFVPLFNGKDLTGWRVDRGDTKGWGVADQELIAWGQDGKTRDYLLSERAYADFRLRLEFNLTRGTSSGVALRALIGETLVVKGRPLNDHPVIKLGDNRPPETGTTYGIMNTSPAAPSHSAEMQPAGTWNRMEIELKGRSVRVWVNGKETVNATLAASALLEDGSLPGLVRSRGRIGFQRLFGTARFRNIEIKELPADAPADATAPAAVKRFGVDIPEKYRAHWRLADGYLEQNVAVPNVWIAFGDTNWKDYDYSVEFIRVRGSDQCGLFFLSDNEKKQWCMYGLGTFLNKAHTIEWARGKGKPKLVQRPGGIPNGAWQTARVRVRGGQARCFLNGPKILECKIDTHSTGRVGLRTWGSTYRFRNLKVTAPDGKVLLEGLPDLDSAWSTR
jgi:hypothetical protein